MAQLNSGRFTPLIEALESMDPISLSNISGRHRAFRLVLLGLAHYHSGRLNRAQEVLEQAREIDDSVPGPVTGWGGNSNWSVIRSYLANILDLKGQIALANQARDEAWEAMRHLDDIPSVCSAANFKAREIGGLGRKHTHTFAGHFRGFPEKLLH